MEAPKLGGYSLRVQLFSPTVVTTSDRPVRLYRVVTRPDATVWEFCQEASRIHEINYGNPISIKKCQDDEGFDITGSEILGNLFTNAATIRIIEAPAHPTDRDSVPPTSALRFNPLTDIKSRLGKRARAGSVARGSSSPQNAPRSKKRQKVADVDPDQPIPSLEIGLRALENQERIERSQETNLIPDSQESVDLDISHRQSSAHRRLKDKLFEVPGTPSPSPPREARSMSSNQRPNGERQKSNSAARETNGISSTQPLKHNEAPSQEGFVGAQSIASNPQRSKSASYHIGRANQRGTSVSTAATSPLLGQVDAASGVVNRNTVNGTRGNHSGPPSTSGKNPAAQSLKASKKQSPQFVHEDSLYDHVPSDNDEATAAILNSKKAGLRMRQSPKAGLPGLNFTNGKYNTPPSMPRRTPGSREQSARGSPGELPLTPRSKIRIDKERQDAAEIRKAKTSAAQAAEKRRRDDKENKAAEAARAKEEQSQREELERLGVEDLQRAQAEQAEIVEANRLKQEQEDRAKQAAEERAVAAKEKELEEQRAQQQKAEQERLEAGTLAKANIEKGRPEEEPTGAEKSTELQRIDLKSSSPQVILPSRESLGRRSISGTPNSHRAQSSTAFIPSGRKSSLRVSYASSSPMRQSGSPNLTPSSTGIESQIPLPNSEKRRVSFAQTTESKTPIKPVTRVAPPKSDSSTPIPSSSAPKRNPQITKIVPVTKQSHSPIMPPSRVGLFKERSATPIVPPKTSTKVLPPKLEAKSSETSVGSTTRKSPVVPPVTSKAEPMSTVSPFNKTETVEISSESESESESASESDSDSDSDGDNHQDVDYNEQVVSQEKPANQEKPEPSVEVKNSSKTSSEDEDSTDDDSEEDIPARVTPEKLAARAERITRSPSERNTWRAYTDDFEKAHFEKDQNRASTSSSAREASRSPIVFSQHPQLSRAAKAKRSASPASDNSSQEEEEDVVEEDIELADAQNSDVDSESDEEQDLEGPSDEEMVDAPTEAASAQVDRNDESGSASNEEDNQEKEVPESSPQLPRLKQLSEKPALNSNEFTGEDCTDKDSGDTQEELAQQLTSSQYEARPSVVSSSIRYPPSSSVAQSSQQRPPPSMRFGTKLSELAAKQSRIPSLTKSSVAASRSAQHTSKGLSDQEVSEDESDDSSSSSEESEEERPVSKSSQPVRTNAKRAKSVSSNSDTDSDNSEEEVDEQTRIRNEVMADIARKVRGGQNSAPSSSINSKPSNTQKLQSKRATPGYGKAAPKKKDPYITGYSFSQPK